MFQMQRSVLLYIWKLDQVNFHRKINTEISGKCSRQKIPLKLNFNENMSYETNNFCFFFSKCRSKNCSESCDELSDTLVSCIFKILTFKIEWSICQFASYRLAKMKKKYFTLRMSKTKPVASIHLRIARMAALSHSETL